MASRRGRYEPLDLLGEGGTSSVFLARSIGEAGFERRVALKVLRPELSLHPEARELFLDEARLASRIDHPNVVQILDLGLDGDEYYIAMEHVDGDDLESILWRLAERVSRRMKAAGLAGRSVTLKLKDTDFQILTRSRSGLAPTQLAIRIFEPARQMLKSACDGTAFRLIGVGMSDLCDAADADKGDLADQTVLRQAHMESAIDRIRDKFGAGALQKGIALRRPQR